jgi:hypothetical protein
MIEFVNKKTIAVDDTLTKKGWAADAEAVGKALAAGGTVGGATEAYVDAAIEDVKNYVDEAIENIDIPEGTDIDLSDYATIAYVDEAIANIPIGEGGEVDLSNYYTKKETNQILTSYATDDDLKKYYTAEETQTLLNTYYTKTETDNKFASKDYVDDAIANVPTGGGGSGMANLHDATNGGVVGDSTNHAAGKNAFVFGESNMSYMEGNTLFGKGNADWVGATYSLITGIGNTNAQGSAMIVGGTYCATETDAILTLGNGSNDSNLSNAFVVKKDGTVKTAKGDLVTAEYVGTAISNALAAIGVAEDGEY